MQYSMSLSLFYICCKQSTHRYSRLLYRGCFCSKQPWKIEMVSPSGKKIVLLTGQRKFRVPKHKDRPSALKQTHHIHSSPCCPWEPWRDKGSEENMQLVLLLPVPRVIPLFTSGPGVSKLLPILKKLWQVIC